MVDAVAVAAATTTDAFLGGRFAAVQPADGRHRSGLEALLLGAAVESSFGGTVVDLGAGAGVAGLVVVSRCPGARVVLVERDPIAVDCARATLALAGNRALAGRVTIVTADVLAPEALRTADGLGRAIADMVIVNPPFRPADAGTVSPNPARSAAHVLSGGELGTWLRTTASVLRPRGRLAVIFRADGLATLLAACRGRFGAIDVLPVHPRAHLPAKRVLVHAVQGSRAGTRMLPPLVLHQPAGHLYTPQARAILHDGAGLAEADVRWRIGGRP
jgi:tRNA1(Val) A37 N6-methylase TrmN6